MKFYDIYPTVGSVPMILWSVTYIDQDQYASLTSNIVYWAPILVLGIPIFNKYFYFLKKMAKGLDPVFKIRNSVLYKFLETSDAYHTLSKI